ncbi:16S rRNA (uracil(1498)-N(3))-methyltransferase [candidate division KSB1 bacterium]|nr:16S rRNA (uracil(1498)-N(3))-methyltransferase [candidate division KSB1 bacterium]
MAHLEQYYAAPERICDGRILLVEEEFNHAVRVRRKRIGDHLIVVDGEGHRYGGPVVELQKERLVLRIDSVEDEVNEPTVHLTLAHVWPRGQQMDWVIEKGTEIGVSRFLPVLSERSIIDPAHRLQRLQKKAIAAMKQCARCRLPQIDLPIPLAECLNQPDGIGLIAHAFAADRSEEAIFDRIRRVGRAVVLIGPEGGFSDAEVEQALHSGWIPLELGARRLRSETAALVAAVKILTRIEEI